MNSLSRLLQNHFKRSGNKIVFKNELSLNELSLLMWDRLGYRGMDSSVLSRVIHGRRLFTYRQLEVFCEALSLSAREKIELEHALSHDILSRNNIATDIFKTKGQILGILRLLRKDGHPDETISLAQTFENIIDSKSYLQSQDRKLLGKIYNEKSRAFGEISSPQRALGLMYEAIARSLSIFGFVKDARRILEETEKLNLDPFYSSQILRGYIRIESR